MFKLGDEDMELSCAISLLYVDGCLHSIIGNKIRSRVRRSRKSELLAVRNGELTPSPVRLPMGLQEQTPAGTWAQVQGVFDLHAPPQPKENTSGRGRGE